METKKVIEERRSIRNFKVEEPSREIIEDILNCGMLAPSAKNRQPWYFVIVKDKAKNKIADLMTEYTQNTDETDERKLMKYLCIKLSITCYHDVYKF